MKTIFDTNKIKYKLGRAVPFDGYQSDVEELSQSGSRIFGDYDFHKLYDIIFTKQIDDSLSETVLRQNKTFNLDIKDIVMSMSDCLRVDDPSSVTMIVIPTYLLVKSRLLSRFSELLAADISVELHNIFAHNRSSDNIFVHFPNLKYIVFDGGKSKDDGYGSIKDIRINLEENINLYSQKTQETPYKTFENVPTTVILRNTPYISRFGTRSLCGMYIIQESSPSGVLDMNKLFSDANKEKFFIISDKQDAFSYFEGVEEIIMPSRETLITADRSHRSNIGEITYNTLRDLKYIKNYNLLHRIHNVHTKMCEIDTQIDRFVNCPNIKEVEFVGLDTMLMYDTKKTHLYDSYANINVFHKLCYLTYMCRNISRVFRFIVPDNDTIISKAKNKLLEDYRELRHNINDYYKFLNSNSIQNSSEEPHIQIYVNDEHIITISRLH